MLAMAGGYFVPFLISPRSLGFGDVKLASPWASRSAGPADASGGGAAAAHVFGGVYGLDLFVFREAPRESDVPFGPFLASGTLIGVLLGAVGA
ncbi:hypothetical protein [Streptomyces sp. NPDC057426]|uniref:hypothetical protein n=1 Tax=Streptomyces sp. NPDC057426 TaxID=3346128 RepID=UPI0036CD47BB